MPAWPLPKAVAAKSILGGMNSQVTVDGVVEDLTRRNVETLCTDESDLVLDGTDNFETRYLLNDYSLRTGRAWVYGACVGSYGTAFAFRPRTTPCLQCLFPRPPAPGSAETCDTSGILAPVVHVVASYQVAQVLKILVGAEPAATMLKVDVWENRMRSWFRLEGAQDPDCPLLRCSSSCAFWKEGSRRHTVRDSAAGTRFRCSRAKTPGWTCPKLARRLRPSGSVSLNDYMMKVRGQRLRAGSVPRRKGHRPGNGGRDRGPSHLRSIRRLLGESTMAKNLRRSCKPRFRYTVGTGFLAMTLLGPVSGPGVG